MIDRLKKILALVDADYADIRYETKKETSIGFEGRDLARVSANSADGHVLRVMYKGGFSTMAFTRPEDAGKAAAAALANAKLLARNVKNPVRLAKARAVKADFRPELSERPDEVSVEEKISLLRSYNAIPLGNDKVVTTSLAYSEICRDKYFVSTEGAEIHEELATVSIAGRGTAKDGGLTQSAFFLIGGSDGLFRLRGREEYFERNTKCLVDMLSAKPVAGGTYNVILDQDLAGTFAHEAFGHFSEADIIEEMPELRKKMSIGARLGSEVVSIVDDPTMPRQLGFYRFDDEGVPAARVQLMKKGVLAGRLHSRRTAAAFGEEATGHCVAEDYRYAPIVRMGTIMIEPDPSTDLEKMLARLDDGLYLCGSKGGQTSGENFTFDAAWGFEVKNGRIGRMIRDINIMGNMFTTLSNIAAVGNDLKLSEFGGCGKGQVNRRSCHGGPHILINGVVVGGAK